jgi:hypothetical protein
MVAFGGIGGGPPMVAFRGGFRGNDEVRKGFTKGEDEPAATKSPRRGKEKA